MNSIAWITLLAAAGLGQVHAQQPAPLSPDNFPPATLRMDAKDFGPVLRYGQCPHDCDKYGARDVWVFRSGNTYYMHYDAAGPTGWLTALATSHDLLHWTEHGTVMDLGPSGADDAGTASYGTTYFDGKIWHMFYVGAWNQSSPPDRVPTGPPGGPGYLTMKAKATSPSGPWIKQPTVIPFRPKAGTWYRETASPGPIVKRGDTYLMFFTGNYTNPLSLGSIGIARTKNLDGPWTVDTAPILTDRAPENASIYYEPTNQTWFLFTNHIKDGSYADAIWVYWTKDIEHWNIANKAIVLDGHNCTWSHVTIGLPSVIPYHHKLAVFYDAPDNPSVNATGANERSIGLAWLDLPLRVPHASAP